MGHACAKVPTEYEETIDGRLNGKWRSKRVNKTAPAKETQGSKVDVESSSGEKGKLQQSGPQVHQLNDDDFIHSLLRRANSGGEQERLAAAIAAAPEVHDGDNEACEE